MSSQFVVLLVAVSLTACDRTRLVPAYSLAEQVECIAGDFTLTSSVPEVMLVLDRSGSMSSAFGNGTRWSTLVSALESTLPTTSETMALGMTLFPAAGSAAECRVPVAPEFVPATGQVSALLSTVRTSTLVGGTPTAEALDVAAAGFTSTKPRAMVLATDGLPNCNASLNPSSCACPSGTSCTTAQRCIDDARTLERLSAHASDGIPTWIIGIGGDVTATTLLDAMALAGGGAPHSVSALDAAQLQSAFASIRDELSSCVFTSPSAPDANGTITVMLDGVFVPQDASGTNGWTWTSQQRGELVLRGDWCAKAIRHPTSSPQGALTAMNPIVRVSVTCEPVEEAVTTVSPE
ncbi:MAG: VWA domain-containing protein [Archangium sp.]|nr:VWA domain-containing protein [Archangium sp.]